MTCDSDLEEQKVASQLLYWENSARAAGKPVGLLGPEYYSQLETWCLMYSQFTVIHVAESAAVG